MRTKSILVTVFVLLGLSSSGCILALPIDSFKQGGFTESDRRILLTKEIKAMHDMLQFGRVDEAMVAVDPSVVSKLRLQFKRQFKNEKLVEATVEDIDYTDSSKRAVAHVTVKSFHTTDYLVKEQPIAEEWEFNLGGAWKLLSYQVEETPPHV